jgi:hypothetical protein
MAQPMATRTLLTSEVNILPQPEEVERQRITWKF